MPRPLSLPLLIGLLLLPTALRSWSEQPSPSPAPPPTVTRTEFQTLNDGIDPDSFAAQPRTLYRCGDRYGRLEERLNPETKAQRVLVVNEPNSWVINLVDKTGQHTKEEVPTFHLPLLPDRVDLPKRLSYLEYGQERGFFERCQAKVGMDDLEGVRYRVLELSEGTYRLRLFCQVESHQPVQLDVEHNGRRAFYIRYLSYVTDIPFDPGLFQVPPGVKLAAEH